MRVVVVIRDPVYRLGIRTLVDREPGLLVEEGLAFEARAVVALRRLQPDIIVAGLVQVSDDAVAIVQAIRTACPWTTVLIAIPGLDRTKGSALRRDGVDEVILYERMNDRLGEALRQAHARSSQDQDQIRRVIRGLSPVKRAVAALLSLGLTDREMADRLMIAEGTVHKHMSEVRTAFGWPKRSALMLALARLRPSTDYVHGLNGLPAPTDRHGWQSSGDTTGVREPGRLEPENYFVPWYTDESS